LKNKIISCDLLVDYSVQPDVTWKNHCLQTVYEKTNFTPAW